MGRVRGALPAWPAVGAALILIWLGCLPATAHADNADETAATYGELPKNTIVVRPGQDPINLPTPRYLIDGLQVESAVVCARTNERLRTSLQEATQAATRAAERPSGVWQALKWSGAGAAIVGAFVAGAVLL